MSDPSADADGTTEATRSAEGHEAKVAHAADRMPTAEEERAAERNTLDPAVAEQYQDAARAGASVKGEGEIE